MTSELDLIVTRNVSILFTLVVFMSSSEGCSHSKMHSQDAEGAGDAVIASNEWFAGARWKNRLLIFTGTGEAADHQRKMALESRTSYLERDLIVIHLDDDTASVIVGEDRPLPESELFRQRFAMTDATFEAVLVGKDGGAKERRKAPFQTEELFGIIDAMPMRMREMRR